MDLGLSGLLYFQYKEGNVYQVVFPKTITQDGSTHNYVYAFSVIEQISKRLLHYNVSLSETACANATDFQNSLIAARKLFEILGSGQYSGGVGTGDVHRLMGEEANGTDLLRSAIADYTLNRFERKFEEDFLLWEIISAINGNPEEIFRQLKYFDMHGVLSFSPPLDRFAPKLKLTDILPWVIKLEVSAKSQLIEIINKRVEEQNKKSFDELISMTKQIKNPVFIVHGRNEEIANAIRGYVESLGIQAIILKEQPNKGLTVIEKLEDNSNVGYAIVILSADDEGRLRGDADLLLRARQNVILELGYFMGKIGRNNVASILPEPLNFEKPYDIEGMVYISYDKNEDWKIQLKKELSAAGYGKGPSAPVRRI